MRLIYRYDLEEFVNGVLCELWSFGVVGPVSFDLPVRCCDGESGGRLKFSIDPRSREVSERGAGWDSLKEKASMKSSPRNQYQEVAGMSQVRDENAPLSDQEIDAIKVTQDIISRMAESSQKTKSVFLGVSAAFFLLVGRKAVDADWRAALVFLVVALLFWIMDAHYLRLERQFREHHRAIVRGALSSLGRWDFSPARYRVASLPRVMFSFSEFPYPAVMVLVLLLFL